MVALRFKYGVNRVKLLPSVIYEIFVIKSPFDVNVYHLFIIVL